MDYKYTKTIIKPYLLEHTMNSNHILQKTNLLLSFEIARKISPKDLASIKQKISKVKGSKNKKEQFEKEVETLTENILKKENVPGLLNKKLITPQKTEKLMKTSLEIGNIIDELNLSKEEESFIIVSLVKLLELSITDFENWSKEHSIDSEESGEDEEETD